jgi:uncharacterized protein YjbI with pentapeptide repeats
MSRKESSANIFFKSTKQTVIASALFAYASFLKAFGLSNFYILKSSFPCEVWSSKRKSTQEGWKKGWRFLIGIPFLVFLIVLLEIRLQPEALNVNPSTKLPAANEQATGIKSCSSNISLASFYCFITKSELLKLFETFAIITAFLVYVSNQEAIRDQSIREDWSLIDGARGSKTSGARVSAINRLYLEKESLFGLDAKGADLHGINLTGAILESANLQDTDIRDAILVGANLNEANLSGAHLERAQCQEASFWMADLRNANLSEAQLQHAWLGAVNLNRANLRKANLCDSDLRGSRFNKTIVRGAQFINADLTQASFSDIDFADVRLNDANIKGVRFINPVNLSIENIKGSKNWELAFFSREFAEQHEDLTCYEAEQPWNIELSEYEGSDSAEILWLTDTIQAIEDILEDLRNTKYYSVEDMQRKLEENSLEVPAFSSIRELVMKLEDISEEKQKEFETLISELNQFNDY